MIPPPFDQYCVRRVAELSSADWTKDITSENWPAKQTEMLFGWGKSETHKAVDALVGNGLLMAGVSVPEHGEAWLALTAL
jgi:hypothetical protein